MAPLKSKPCFKLPEKFGAFDIFIGEEEELKQGLGSKVISELFRLHGNQYSYIFADPDSKNIATIECYEKAGFKKILKRNEC